MNIVNFKQLKGFQICMKVCDDSIINKITKNSAHQVRTRPTH